MRYRVMLVSPEERAKGEVCNWYVPKGECVAVFHAETEVGAMRVHRGRIRSGEYPADSYIEEAAGRRVT